WNVAVAARVKPFQDFKRFTLSTRQTRRARIVAPINRLSEHGRYGVTVLVNAELNANRPERYLKVTRPVAVLREPTAHHADRFVALNAQGEVQGAVEQAMAARRPAVRFGVVVNQH